LWQQAQRGSGVRPVGVNGGWRAFRSSSAPSGVLECRRITQPCPSRTPHRCARLDAPLAFCGLASRVHSTSAHAAQRENKPMGLQWTLLCGHSFPANKQPGRAAARVSQEKERGLRVVSCLALLCGHSCPDKKQPGCAAARVGRQKEGGLCGGLRVVSCLALLCGHSCPDKKQPGCAAARVGRQREGGLCGQLSGIEPSPTSTCVIHGPCTRCR